MGSGTVTGLGLRLSKGLVVCENQVPFVPQNCKGIWERAGRDSGFVGITFFKKLPCTTSKIKTNGYARTSLIRTPELKVCVLEVSAYYEEMSCTSYYTSIKLKMTGAICEASIPEPIDPMLQKKAMLKVRFSICCWLVPIKGPRLVLYLLLAPFCACGGSLACRRRSSNREITNPQTITEIHKGPLERAVVVVGRLLGSHVRVSQSWG